MSGTLAPRHAHVTRTEGDRGVAQIAGVLSHEAGLLLILVVVPEAVLQRFEVCKRRSGRATSHGNGVFAPGEVDLSFGDRGWPDLRLENRIKELRSRWSGSR